MKTITTQVLRTFVCLLSLTLINCETEQLENSPETITIENQDISRLGTIPIKQTLEYIKNIENNSPYARGLELDVDFESIRQEEITNTDAKINLIDATTKFENVESTIMQIEIDGTTQTILYNVIPDETSTSERIVITDLGGAVYNIFDFSDGDLLGEINLNNYTHNENDTIHCWGITCGIDLDYVYLSSTSALNYFYTNNIYSTTMMNYQFVRSLNNYSSMGIAYANYYLSLQNKPCKGDPIKNPEIVSSGSSGKKGGTFGCTRTDDTTCEGVIGKKNHDGLDIKANVNENAFAMYNGTITSIRDSFSPGEYKNDSYGNFIVVTTLINGSTYNIKYNHLNSVSVTQGQTINAGDIIGLSGNTGNAADPDVNPHIHIQVFNSNWSQTLNPEGFMKTKFDSNYNPIINNCQ